MEGRTGGETRVTYPGGGVWAGSCDPPELRRFLDLRIEYQTVSKAKYMWHGAIERTAYVSCCSAESNLYHLRVPDRHLGAFD